MIKKLILENWKTHKKSEFEFGKGTNIVVGSLGSGKSSVMDGICFALFGTYPGVHAKKLALNETIMRKPEKCDFSRIEMEFLHGDKTYKIERLLNEKKANEAKFYINGKFVSGPKPTDVNSKIEEILQLDYNLFSRAIYSEQNELDFFFKLSPLQRKEKFDDILALKKYEKVRSNATSISNRIKKIVSDKRQWLDEQQSKINLNELSSMKDKHKNKGKELIDLEKKLAEARNEIKSMEEKLNEMEKKSKEYSFLKDLYAKSLARLDDLKERIAEKENELSVSLKDARLEDWKKKADIFKEQLASLKKEEEKISSLDSSLKVLNERIQINRKNIEEKILSLPLKTKNPREIKSKSEEIKAKLETSEKNLSLLKKEAEGMQKKANNLLQLIGMGESKIKEIDKHVTSLENSKAGCPVCRRELKHSSKKEIIFRYLEDKARIEADNKTRANSLKATEDKINIHKDLLSKKENEILDLKEKYNSHIQAVQIARDVAAKENEISLLEKEKLKLEKTLDDFKKEDSAKKIEKTENKIKETENIIEAITLYEKKSSLFEESRKIDSQLKELDFDEKEFQNLKVRFAESKSDIKAKENQITSLNELMQEISSNIKSVESLQSQLISLKQEIENYDLIVEKLRIFIHSLKETQAQLRDYLIDSINQAMEDIWFRIYPYGDYINAKIEIISGNYEFFVKELDGEWVKVEGMLSGGERSAAALTLRISISLVLARNLSWLILDEPTHNLDIKAVSELSSLMKNHLPEFVDQIFVITHDKEMEKAASSAYYFLERDKNNNGITKPVLQYSDN